MRVVYWTDLYGFEAKILFMIILRSSFQLLIDLILLVGCWLYYSYKETDGIYTVEIRIDLQTSSYSAQTVFKR